MSDAEDASAGGYDVNLTCSLGMFHSLASNLNSAQRAQTLSR
jgi:hypothetical protein